MCSIINVFNADLHRIIITDIIRDIHLHHSTKIVSHFIFGWTNRTRVNNTSRVQTATTAASSPRVTFGVSTTVRAGETSFEL